MNELKATINFTKQTFVINGVDLISGDYNSTKITFNFEDIKNGTKILEIRPKDSEDKNPTFMGEIINNEVILVSKDSENNSISPFTNGGVYLLEVSVYGDDSKLSTITKSINVLSEQIILSDDIVTPYLPIFDELIQEINTAITETNNLNITITKDNGITTVTLTKKDGTTSIVTIKDGVDGVDGVGIESISKISTSGLVDTYRITLTDDSYYDYQVVNGVNGTDGRGIASITKTGTSGLVDTYTITYTDGTTSTFEVTNGEDGEVTQEQLDETNRAIDYYKLTLNALPKVTGTGISLTLNDTAEAPMPMSLAPSELSQDGTPTPETPQNIHTVSGDNTIKIENSNLFNTNWWQPRENNGITATIENGVLTLNGTSTSTVYINFSVSSNNLPNNCYWYVSNDKNASILLQVQRTIGGTANINTSSTTQKVQIGNSNTITSGYIRVNSGITLTNCKVYVDVRNTNIDISNFAFVEHQEQSLPLNLGTLEYCKIGTYEDEFVIPDKQLFDGEIELGSINPADGTLSNSTTRTRSKNFIKVKPNTTYHFTRTTGDRRWVIGYTSNQTGITDGNNSGYASALANQGIQALSFTFTTSPTTEYIKWYDTSSTDLTEKVMISLEETPYEPYNPDGKWYLKKNIDKVVLDGSESEWGDRPNYSYADRFVKDGVFPTNNKNMFCNYFTVAQSTTDTYPYLTNNGTQCVVNFTEKGTTTLAQFKTWLSTHNTKVYYPLATPQYILLNDTLQSQLNEIYNWVKAYQDQTNISQVNNDLPFVIKASALKDISNL